MRIQALNNGFQSAEQQVEVKRRRGAVDRNLTAGRQPPGRARTVDEVEVTITDQVEVANRRLGAVGEHDAAVGVEFHHNLFVRLQRDTVDGAHPDAGDPHRISGLQTRRIVEDRRIAGCRTGAVLAEDEEQKRGQHRHHDGEDTELDQRRAQ